MIPAAFDYVRVNSLAAAIELLQRDPDATKLVAGGHTLIPTLKLRLATPSLLIDIRQVEEIRGIQIDETKIRIGALTTHAELLASEALSEELPLFRQAAPLIADPQVRNRGTIGGSLANADPAADWPAVVIALDAELEIAHAGGFRRVTARDFFVDIFTTALEPGEILSSVIIPRANPGTRFAYRKIRHPASGYAVVGVAVTAQLRGNEVAKATIGVTGAAGSAFAGDVAAEFLIGTSLSPETATAAAELLAEATECLSDRYASAEYRSSLLATQTRRALLALVS